MLSKINLIMRTLLIMAAVLLSFNFTGCFPYSAKYVNEGYDTASIEIRYKKPITIAFYDNPRFKQQEYSYYVDGYGTIFSYFDYLVYDTVYVRELPENYKFEYTFRSPNIDIDGNGYLNFEIDTLGTFSCSGNQAVIKIFPYDEFSMYDFVWIPEDTYVDTVLLSANREAYTDILESITVRNSQSETIHTEYYNMMYSGIDKINDCIIFKNTIQPENHSRVTTR